MDQLARVRPQCPLARTSKSHQAVYLKSVLTFVISENFNQNRWTVLSLGCVLIADDASDKFWPVVVPPSCIGQTVNELLG